MLDERFKSVPAIVSQSVEQTSQAAAGTSDVTGSKVNVDNKPAAGTAYRVTLAGTKTGANAAHTVTLVLGGTTVMTLTADAATAVDWMATFTIIFKDSNNQRVMGNMQGNALDCENDYAAGTVDCSAGAELKAQITSGHASDTVTAELVTVEKWQHELTTS